MENEYLIWQVAAIALAAGVLIGALAYRLFAPAVKQAGKVQTDLAQAREELATYKASVDTHFDKTSELVNDLTQNYVKVYQHLAEGVQTLGNNRSFNNLLEQQQGKVVLSVDDQIPEVETAADSARLDAAETETPPLAEPVDFVVAGSVAESKPIEGEAEKIEPDEAKAAPAATGESPVADSSEEKAAEPEVDTAESAEKAADTKTKPAAKTPDAPATK